MGGGRGGGEEASSAEERVKKGLLLFSTSKAEDSQKTGWSHGMGYVQGHNKVFERESRRKQAAARVLR